MRRMGLALPRNPKAFLVLRRYSAPLLETGLGSFVGPIPEEPADMELKQALSDCDLLSTTQVWKHTGGTRATKSQCSSV